MNKFWKISFIVIGVLTGLGCLLLFFGALAGGLGAAVEMAKNGEIPFVHMPKEDIWENMYAMEDWDDWDENAGMSAAMSAESYEDDNVAKISEVTGLSLELSGCLMEIKATEGDKFKLEVEHCDDFSYEVENHILTVRAETGRRERDKPWKHKMDAEHLENWEMGKLILYVPDAMVFDTADIELDAGKLTIEDINVTDMSVELAAGEFVYQGEVTGDLGIDCDAGRVQIALTGNPQDYNYEVSLDIGEIRAGNGHWSGITAEEFLNNDADKNISLDCDMGQIIVSFPQEQ